jgi:multiple sugar transport system permease protein
MRKKILGYQIKDLIFPAKVLLPIVIFYSLFFVYPMLSGVIISMQRWNILGGGKFIGLQNFSRLMKDDLFWKSFINTIYYTGLFVLFSIPSALAIAFGLTKLKPTTGKILLGIYFVPVLTSVVATSVFFTYLYWTRGGLINTVLEMLQLPAQPFLESSRQALPSVVFMHIWQSTGIRVVIFFAGLLAVPQTYYEASDIDGAGGWTKFYRITLPLIKPTLVFITIITIISTMQVFGPIYMMTQGGPGDSSYVLGLFIYQKAFSSNQFGYSTAASFITFLFLLVIIALQFRLMKVTEENAQA